MYMIPTSSLNTELFFFGPNISFNVILNMIKFKIILEGQQQLNNSVKGPLEQVKLGKTLPVPLCRN